MKYEVKNVKNFQGREGYGYECSLYCDGKRVGKVVDVASGGQARFYWADPKAGDEGALVEHIKGKTFEHYGEVYSHSVDTFVGALVDEYEKNKQYKKWCKNKTMFRLKGDKEGQWRSLRVPYGDPRAKSLLEQKYGDKVEEILNERFAA